MSESLQPPTGEDGERGREEDEGEREKERRERGGERERRKGGGGEGETTPYLRVLPDIEMPPVQLHNRSFLHMHENLVQRLISVALQVTPHHKCTIIG